MIFKNIYKQMLLAFLRLIQINFTPICCIYRRYKFIHLICVYVDATDVACVDIIEFVKQLPNS